MRSRNEWSIGTIATESMASIFISSPDHLSRTVNTCGHGCIALRSLPLGTIQYQGW
jgi:hypothetical protein